MKTEFTREAGELETQEQLSRIFSAKLEESANARLIAAAPELLSVLKSALVEMEFQDSGGVMLFFEQTRAARALIAKIEGKE